MSEPRIHISAIRCRRTYNNVLLNQPQNFNWGLIKSNKIDRRSLHFGRNFHQYMDNSTLHGLKYVGDETLSPIERIFFAVSFLFVFSLSIYFITNAYMKWSASPVIITLSSEAKKITEYPFPAVTVCNMNMAQKSAVKSLVPRSVEYSMLQSICTQDGTKNITAGRGEWGRFRRLLLNVTQSCQQMLISCRFGGVNHSCSDIFSKILTDEGLCCTFNAIRRTFRMKSDYNHSLDFGINDENLDEKTITWDTERGFTKSKRNRSKDANYPRAPLGSGKGIGLSVVMDVQMDEYYCSSTSSYGFKMLLHSPFESPNIAHFGKSVASGFETLISVTPVISEASDSIRRIPIATRQCLFQNENYLQFYRTYSRMNCKIECESKLFARYCNCILYYMPRANDSVKICGLPDTKCVAEVGQRLKLKTNNSYACNCLPSCFDVQYESEISLAQILPNTAVVKENNLTLSNVAILHIYFRNFYFRGQKKEEFVGLTDFLSNTGGLLGLFMGFSLVSIVEIIYFMSLRPYYAHMRHYQSHRGAIRQLWQKLKQSLGFKKEPVCPVRMQAIPANKIIIYPRIE